MLQTLYAQVSLIAFLAVAGACWLWGGRTERLGAIGLMAVTLAAMLLQHQDWKAVQYGLLVSDTLLAGFFIWLTLKSHRLWPPFAAAIQLLSVLFHLGRIADAGLRPAVYLHALGAVSYVLLFIMAIGVWSAWKDRRRAVVRTA